MIWSELSITQIENKLGTDAVSGLRTRAARTRLKKVRQIGEAHYIWRTLKILIHQLTSPLVFLLILSALISFIIGNLRDGYFIIGIVILNAILGFIQEYRADHALRSLGNLAPSEVKVVRDRKIIGVPIKLLVPGDVVLLDAGVVVPADIRLVLAAGMEVNESQLTGESLPAPKIAQPLKLSGDNTVIQKNMVFYGSTVEKGYGRGIVIAAGRDVRFAKLLKASERYEKSVTPLDAQIRLIGRIILAGAFGAVLIAFIAAIFQTGSVYYAMQLSVNLFVAAVPEGLPIVVTIILAVTVWRMASKKVIVRRLDAADMLGNVDLLLTDKTGTLTQGKITVQNLWSDNKLVGAGDLNHRSVKNNSTINRILLAANLANSHHSIDGGQKRVTVDKVDAAFGAMARKYGFGFNQLSEWEVADEMVFDVKIRLSAVLARSQKKSFIFVKGAPEVLLRRAGNILIAGKTLEITQRLTDEYNMACKRMARRGMRVVAVAQKKIGSQNKLEDADIDRLTILGLVGMEDSPREDVAGSVEEVLKAGIDIKMVTGDMPVTAQAIAQSVAIARKNDFVVRGDDIENLLKNNPGKILKAKVFARATPEHKVMIVKYFQGKGLSVAMIGDGVNDAAALEAANIGIAVVGESGDVARQTSDIALLDGDFTTLAEGIKHGRTAWQNIRKILFFLLSTNIAEVMIIIIALLASLPLPFSPIQILWINIITDTASDEALAFEPPEDTISKVGKSIFNKVLTRRMLVAAAVQTVVVAGVYIWALPRYGAKAGTIAFVILIAMQIFNLFNARSLSKTIFMWRRRHNWWLWGAAGLTTILLFASLYWMPLSELLGLTKINIGTTLSIFLLGLIIIGVVEIDKALTRDKSS